MGLSTLDFTYRIITVLYKIYVIDSQQNHSRLLTNIPSNVKIHIVLISYQGLSGYYDKVTIRSTPQSSDDRFLSVVIFYPDIPDIFWYERIDLSSFWSEGLL